MATANKLVLAKVLMTCLAPNPLRQDQQHARMDFIKPHDNPSYLTFTRRRGLIRNNPKNNEWVG